MMSAAASLGPDDSPVQQAPNAGVLPVEGLAAHVEAPNPGGRRPVETPIQQAPNTVGSLEELSDQQSLNSSNGRDEGPDRRISPDSGRRRRPDQRRPSGGLGGPSWPELLGFLFLSYNAGMAIYQSWGDVIAIATIFSAYCNIVSLFVSLKWFQQAPAGSRERRTHMVTAWLLTMALIFGYAYQAGFGTAAKTLQVALLQWVMIGTSGIAAYFLLSQEDRSDATLDEELIDV